MFPQSILVSMCLLISFEVWAWSAPIHSASGESVYQRMTDNERRYYAQLAKQLPGSVNYVRDMSAWVDSVRSAPIREVFNGDVPRALSEFSHRHSSDWHYENYPFTRATNKTSCRVTNRGQLEEAFAAVDRSLKESLTARQEAILIAFAVHLIEDAHQPLHVSTLVRPNCDLDRGGNEYCLHIMGEQCAMNLHRLWDGAFTPGKHFWRSLNRAADESRPINIELELILTEGRDLSEFVYSQHEHRTPSREYLSQSRLIAQERLDKMVRRVSGYLRQHYQFKQRESR